MKTRKLIDLLNKCDPEGDVFCQYEGEYGECSVDVIAVLESKNNGNAFIACHDESEDKPKEGAN